MIGTKLEKAGWRQGSIVKCNDISRILFQAPMKNDPNLALIVASQSCDLANNQIILDPIIEFSVARKIDQLDGNCTHNKNPRRLHTTLSIRSNDSSIINSQHLECKAFEKVSIAKEYIANMSPDNGSILENKNLESYVAWLAARYQRPALPTKFNEQLQFKDPKNKRKEIAKKLNPHLSGIYVYINPDKDILEGEFYSVNLLGLVSVDFKGDLKEIEAELSPYAKIMQDAGMDVKFSVQREDQVSVATIRKFKRFYYDDLSIKDETSLPIEALAQ